MAQVWMEKHVPEIAYRSVTWYQIGCFCPRKNVINYILTGISNSLLELVTDEFIIIINKSVVRLL